MRTPADGEVWRLGHLEGPLDFHYRWEGVGGSAQRLGDQTTGDGGGGKSEWRKEWKRHYWEGAKKIHCRWERGERKEKWNVITEREQRKSLPVGGGWGEGEVKTLLLVESNKKYIHCRLKGVSGRRSEDFITGREKKKEIPCRWKGVGGRRSEDFITGREQKQFTAVGAGGGWVEGEMKTLLLGGSTQKSMPVGGGWAEKRETLLPGGSTKSHCRCEWGWVCGGKCEDFVTGRWPRSRNIKSESKVGKHKATKKGSRGQHTHRKQNKIRTSKQSKHKVKFVSQPLPVKKKN